MSDNPIVKSPSGRPQRTRVGTRNILTVRDKDPEYMYRFVTDDVDTDRVESFKEQGYELVEKTKVGDKRVAKDSAPGTPTRISVGNGKYGYLMRIKKAWYDEDQRAKQNDLDALEESIKKPNLDGAYGEIKISRGE